MPDTVATSAAASSPKPPGALIESAAALAIAASLCFIPSVCTAGTDSDWALYQCVVQGDRGACQVVPPEPARYDEQRIEPGPYARYLMYTGRSKAEAITMARHVGESPRLVLVRVVHTELTSLQKYERWQGHPVPQDRAEIILSESIDSGPMSDGKSIAGAPASAP